MCYDKHTTYTYIFGKSQQIYVPCVKSKCTIFLLRRRGTNHIISIYVFIQQVSIYFFHTFSFDHCLYIEEIYEPFKPIGPFDQIKSKAPICSVYSLDRERERVRTMHAQRKLQYKVYCFRIRRKVAMFLQHISQIQIFFFVSLQVNRQ